MKQLRFTTTGPTGILSVADAIPLITPNEIGELNNTGEVKGDRAYIHHDAEDIAGFDIPMFIDGDLRQLDLSHAEQDILMLLPSGEYACKAEIQDGNVIDGNAYYITLKK